MSETGGERPVRDQIAALARSRREQLQRRQRDLMTEYLANAYEIARLQGTELAAGVTMERRSPEAPGIAHLGRGTVEVDRGPVGPVPGIEIPEFERFQPAMK